MARDRDRPLDTGVAAETVISIIGPGMRIVGDLETDGTVRVEGHVDGSVRAGKAVVVGKEGFIKGDIETQDAVFSGRVLGRVVAESRLELQATARVEGEVHARRMQLEDGAVLNGTIQMGDARAQGGLSAAEPPSTRNASKPGGVKAGATGAATGG